MATSVRTIIANLRLAVDQLEAIARAAEEYSADLSTLDNSVDDVLTQISEIEEEVQNAKDEAEDEDVEDESDSEEEEDEDDE